MSLPFFSISAIDSSLPVEYCHDLYFFGASLTLCAICFALGSVILLRHIWLNEDRCMFFAERLYKHELEDMIQWRSRPHNVDNYGFFYYSKNITYCTSIVVHCMKGEFFLCRMTE